MKVWSICVAISVNITDIWTTFGTEHKYHTINTPEWPNSHKLKIQDGGGRHLEFRKNVNNFGLDKDILHQIIWGDARRRRGEDHVVQKSKPEVNLRDVIKWRSEAYVRRSQWLSRIFEPNFIQSSSTALVTWRNVPNYMTWKSKKVEAAVLDFGKCQ